MFWNGDCHGHITKKIAGSGPQTSGTNRVRAGNQMRLVPELSSKYALILKYFNCDVVAPSVHLIYELGLREIL
ncbi:hypothetical protein GCM10007857_83350 [Bradyrhizobium iriomotense]|uniref:Uncharacterized protein n=1 Tax=Bradyrhizobium iriomotense TaxID=441950 RepID=A0ABQ6BB61_9BRAD|nr:hypothetical protein GCM10007857_83350 [Bradyrhizobium iriomotense]